MLEVFSVSAKMALPHSFTRAGLIQQIKLRFRRMVLTVRLVESVLSPDENGRTVRGPQ
jgi:hypothetical protein